MASENADNAAEKQGIRGKEREKPREPVSPHGCRVQGSPKPWPGLEDRIALGRYHGRLPMTS